MLIVKNNNVPIHLLHYSCISSMNIIYIIDLPSTTSCFLIRKNNHYKTTKRLLVQKIWTLKKGLVSQHFGNISFAFITGQLTMNVCKKQKSQDNKKIHNLTSFSSISLVSITRCSDRCLHEGSQMLQQTTMYQIYTFTTSQEQFLQSSYCVCMLVLPFELLSFRIRNPYNGSVT